MPTTVQHGSYLDEVSAEDIVDRKRKPPYEGTPKRSVYDTPGSRHRNNESEGPIEFALKLSAKPRALILVPRKSLRDVREGFGPQL
jgi:hypothetical protein